MDQRQAPHAYARPPQDRPLIQNPNHQPQSQPPAPQSHSTIFHTPSSQQPPVQIPFSDPFSRRAADPFLPNPQSQRRGSYGMPSGRDGVSGAAERTSLAAAWPSSTSGPPQDPPPLQHQHQHQLYHQHQQSAPPPPPPLSSAVSASATASYAYDLARRRSLGGHSPPRYGAGASTELPPPPGLFGRPPMPPPSPSQQPPQAAPYPGQRGPPPPPPFTAGRELPGLGPTPRPGTGMSISSILGTDPPASQAPAPQHSPPSAATQSPVGTSMQPPSPRRGQSVTSKLDYGQWRGPQTPDKVPVSAPLRASETTSYSASSSPAHFAGARRSPEFARRSHGHGLLQQMYEPGPREGGRTYVSSPADPHDREPPRQGVEERVPPQPNSQPAGFAIPSQDGGMRDVPTSRPPFHTFSPIERREEQRLPVTSAYGDRSETASTSTSRDRPITVEPQGHSGYSPPQNQPTVGRENTRDEINRDTPLRRDEFNGPFRTGFRNQYYQLGAVPGPEAPRSHPQSLDPFRRPNEGQNPLFGPEYRPNERPPHPPMEIHNQDRRTSEPQPHGGDLQYRNAPHDQAPPLMQRSRSSLGIGPEGKRGRASPLPQAVQGAQAQPIGVGSDPSIKSEFGRIFQGLGSGLGGHIPGSSTPSRQSPLPQRSSGPDVEPIVLSDGDGAKMSRIGSKGPKKGRRVKDEDGESNDGRGTPLGSGTRGAKRTKVGHHHHLHQHGHPHHHHIHNHMHSRPEESPFPPAPNPASTPTGTAHHHHHIHPSHHHHHATPRSAIPPSTPVIPFRKPSTTVINQAVVDMVADRPRNHLGSELYAPTIEPQPFATSSHVEDKYGYFLKYNPSRRFGEDDWNCTFTIRVSRDYLTRESREKICSDRNLFGSGVYSDDSDPVAILIHSGWLRGEWSDDIDTRLLDLPSPPPEDQEVDEEMITKPTTPIIPPDDMDMHITVLILPALKQYQGSVMYGIKSRDYDEQHDGMSYMIHKIRWTDEGASSRNLERTGKARRMQIEAAQSLVALFANPAGGQQQQQQQQGKGKNGTLERVPLAQVAA